MAWILAAVALALTAWFTSQLSSLQRLRHIPGPPLAAWTNLWMVYSQLTGRIHLTLHDLVQKHGTQHPMSQVNPFLRPPLADRQP